MIAWCFLCLLSRVPTAGNFDEQLSRVVACYVVVAAYLSEYVCLQRTVGEYDTSQNNQHRVNGLRESIGFLVRLCTRVRMLAKYTPENSVAIHGAAVIAVEFALVQVVVVVGPSSSSDSTATTAAAATTTATTTTSSSSSSSSNSD
jgi:hypothetical protein